jgi:hypothetical protein
MSAYLVAPAARYHCDHRFTREIIQLPTWRSQPAVLEGKFYLHESGLGRLLRAMNITEDVPSSVPMSQIARDCILAYRAAIFRYWYG